MTIATMLNATNYADIKSQETLLILNCEKNHQSATETNLYWHKKSSVHMEVFSLRKLNNKSKLSSFFRDVLWTAEL